VRNLADGAVEVVAAGTLRSMEQFLDQLRCGPPLSRVDRCDVQPDIPPESDIGEFLIR
jgi:acylphosphatase